MTIGRFFETQRAGNAVIVALLQPIGSLANDAVMAELDAVIAELQPDRQPAVVVDFAHTPYFGSSLLESLRILWRSLESRSGQMRLCNVSPIGREILGLAKFDSLWPIVADRPTALATLASRTDTATANWPADLRELLTAYADGPDQLRAALAGLSSSQLRRAAAPGNWSCLQVVCHIADFEIVYADRIKRVLVEDHPTMFGGDPDQFAARLHYNERDIDTELAMIAAIRRHVVSVLQRATPADFDREGVHSADGPLSLQTLFGRIAGHIPHHLKFVAEKRKAL